MSVAFSDSLRQTIAAEGPQPLERVMQGAVQAYYARGTAFGAAGDFITAPEISQTFGEILGLWAAVVWQGLGMPDRVMLVEVGPGRGTLMADVLRAAAAVPPFAAALEVHLVETSPALRVQQKVALAARGASAHWHDTLDSLPEGPMILLGNEFIDALPIEQWVRGAEDWHLRQIDWDDSAQEFFFVTGPSAQSLGRNLDVFGAPFTGVAGEPVALPEGTIAELCPQGLAVAALLAQRVAKQRGAALLIDYGNAESAAGESLQALKGHKYYPPLKEMGLIDLTAHVDFARLCQAARAHGAVAYGPLSQGRFLSGLGIEARANLLMRKATPAQALEISQGVHRLINRSEMGTLFKVIALTDPISPPPPGFEATPNP
jgi:SAM-dependent MidA family methyltransferase